MMIEICDIMAERAVLGSCLLSSTAMTTATEILRPEDFYDTMHRRFFELITGMYQEGKPVDFVTAMAEMRDKGMYEPLGGQSFLVQLTVNLSSTAQLPYYAEIVKDKAGHRRLADAGRAIIDLEPV